MKQHYAYIILFSCAALLQSRVWAVPCHDQQAEFEDIKVNVYDDPMQAMLSSRQTLSENFGPKDLSIQFMCQLQLAMAAKLSEQTIIESKEVILTALAAYREARLPVERVFLEALSLYLFTDLGQIDDDKKIQELEVLSRSSSRAIRVQILLVLHELAVDPKFKAALDLELESLTKPSGTPQDFESIIYHEYQNLRVDRLHETKVTSTKRSSYLPVLRNLGLRYYGALVLVRQAQDFELMGDSSRRKESLALYNEAEGKAKFLASKLVLGRIELGKARILRRSRPISETLDRLEIANGIFVLSQNYLGQAEVWKAIAEVHLEAKRFKEALTAIEKSTNFYPELKEMERNRLRELKARVLFGMGQTQEAADLMMDYVDQAVHLTDALREHSIIAEAARYNLTLEEDRRELLSLQKNTERRQATVELEKQQSRKRGLLIRLGVALATLLGALWLCWLIWKGMQLGKTIRGLNSHMETHVLERFLPPAMVSEVAAGRLLLDERPNSRLVTILAADIVSFTNGTESLGSERIAVILNRFMVAMADVIFEHSGTIDKFIGDGVLAIFGAPVEMDAETQALQASRCAQAMIKALDGLNQELLPGHGWKLRLRIGMHQGVALVGSFGTRQRSEYGAIGYAVHIATRIQAVAGPNEILLTTSVRHHLDSTLCSRRGDLKIREHSQAISMHSLSISAELKAA